MFVSIITGILVEEEEEPPSFDGVTILEDKHDDDVDERRKTFPP